jgi:hypothetical protein
MQSLKQGVVLGLLLACGLGAAWAQQSRPSSGIYTCIDAKGRRLTSDRPILECLDREQKELSPSGTVRRTHGPSLTAVESAVQEEKDRKAAEEKFRLAEEKRREKVLLARYPNRTAHDRERALALSAQEAVVAEAVKRVSELDAQKKKLVTETEFYKADPSKMPAQLKRKIEENEQQIAAQKRFMANQDEEKQRINARFDEELARLKVLWGGPGTMGAAPSTVAGPAPAASAARR